MATENPPGLQERARRLATRILRSIFHSADPTAPLDPLGDWVRINVARLAFVAMAVIPLVFGTMLLADDRLDGAGAAALVGIAIVSAVLAVLGGDIRRIRRIGPGGLELGPEEEAAVDTAISRLTAGLPLLKEHLEAGFHVPGKPRLVEPLLSPDTRWGYELGSDTILHLQHRGLDPKRLSGEDLRRYRLLLLQVSKVAAWQEEHAKAIYVVQLLEPLADSAEEWYVVGAVYRFAYSRMGKLKDHLERARINLEQARERDRDNPRILWQLSWVYDELDRYEPAMKAGRRAIEINRQYLVVAGWIVAVSLLKNEEPEQALQQLKEVPPGSWWEQICSDEELEGLRQGNLARRFATLCSERQAQSQSRAGDGDPASST